MTSVSYVLLMILLLCPVEPRLHAQQMAELIYAPDRPQEEIERWVAAFFITMKCGWPAEAPYEQTCRISSYGEALDILQTYTFENCTLRDIDRIRNWRFDMEEFYRHSDLPSNHDPRLDISPAVMRRLIDDPQLMECWPR